MRALSRSVTIALSTACAVAVGFSGCATGTDGHEDVVSARASALTADDAQPNLLAGPWTFASSDVQPDTAYAIHGDAIDLDFSGYFRWSGTWASGYAGYRFEQPVALVAGARYRLSLVVSNANTPIPSVLRASLSGAGSEQQKSTLGGNGTIDFDFTIGADPGASPVVALTAHPVLGHLGPTDGVGIGVQRYSVAATLVRLSPATISDLGNGSVEYSVVLPSGQAYVEVFARQNGIQNLAQNIVASEAPNGDGTSTYHYVQTGYHAGDVLEYRFYSYLPSSPGLFTPGPIENLWLSAK